MDEIGFVALKRFGLGRRLGEALPTDPRQWLRGQIAATDPMLAATTPNTADGLALVQEVAAELRARKAEAAHLAGGEPFRAPNPEAQHMLAPPQAEPPTHTPGRIAVVQRPDASVATPDAPAAQSDRHAIAQRYKQDAHDILANAITTELPFRERLVWFWTNHFTIAAHGFIPTACAGAYVREAIRPHVTGRFQDMLLAVMHHPAMLAYLDQQLSVGPDSRAGEKRHRGLNENLARECLELHTVSPASGYTQTDVTNFAEILTGWSIESRVEPVGFKFRPFAHEPGSFEVMGRTWPAGEEGGVAILQWLGTHPATYNHLARKLAIHFISDNPQPDDVRRIESVLTETQGNLGAASLAIVDLPDAWRPDTKLSTPQDYVVACLRAVGADPDRIPNLPYLVGSLGQGLFQAPFPIGWPDRAADWAGPEAMMQRADFAFSQAARFSDLDPLDVAHESLGPLLTQDTIDAIRSAGSRRDALTLLMASPEFMRR